MKVLKRGKSATMMVMISIGVAALLAGAILRFNQFRLELIVLGEKELTLEYGSQYTDAGAEAVFYGRFWMKAGRKTDVHVSGDVNVAQIGTYHIRYDAFFGGVHATAERTVHIVDTKKPRIFLQSRRGAYTLPGQTYEEEGFFAWDAYDGDVTDRVVKVQQGSRVIYTVTDSSGNQARAVRRIVWFDPVAPELTLEGADTITLEVGQAYEEPGYAAQDNCDGDLTEKVQISGNVDLNRPGTYTLTYRVADSYGNVTTATRTVVVKAKIQNTVIPSGKVIYLTFDDGPGPYTGNLLDVLAKYDVKATFFVIDSGNESLLRRIVNEGHSIGIHSASHKYRCVYASEEAFFADLEKMQEIIETATGVRTYLMRFPGGSSNTVSSFNQGIMSRLTAAVEERGYRYFDWNVTSGDAGETTKTQQVYENVIAGVQNQQVSIVLQHDIKEFSVNAMERIIRWGLENGYRFLPLDMTSPTVHHHVNN